MLVENETITIRFPIIAQRKRMVERCLFLSTFSLWGNGNASIYPQTVFHISQFIFSPLLDGGSKIDVMKRMFRYPKE